ncbi:hypothetical protein KIL84_013849 [Mauremys mutica]|uniref:Uncharacterized protein n=1 Tax=Mauremys mutica TaxID=74926 RepID=A0A9D4ASV6_9SAUR|nr:hypothetical protein KIL84_013849 [Mauremys mutica]
MTRSVRREKYFTLSMYSTKEATLKNGFNFAIRNLVTEFQIANEYVCTIIMQKSFFQLLISKMNANTTYVIALWIMKKHSAGSDGRDRAGTLKYVSSHNTHSTD